MYDSIIILGATATGKTNISINLAKKLNTEIVNADSMYIYKGLNIGTAKPTIDEMNGIVHHLIGFVEPYATYNVSEYRSDAKEKIKQIIFKDKLPIIVGGTGFYIDSLINNYSYGETIKDESIRTKLEQDLDKYGKDYLYDQLKKYDPDSINKLHPNDTKRVIRALEIYLSSGIKKSEIVNSEPAILKNPLIIGLTYPREQLYDRINLRVDLMIKNGLVDEVTQLYNLGLNPENHQSMKGIGYKEIISYIRNECTLDDAIDKIKQHSRNYAKRQITWFKRNENIIWFDASEDKNIVDKIINLLNKKNTF